jgi:hypothetical protein
MSGDTGHKRKRPGYGDLKQQELFHKLLEGEIKAAWWRSGLSTVSASSSR